MRWRFLCPAVAACLAACSSFAPPHTDHGRIDTSLPADIAAWLCANACRETMPHADPLPWHHGVLVAQRGDAFVVCIERRIDGQSTFVADGRLFAERSVAGALPRLTFAPEPLPPFQSPLATRLSLRVQPFGSGSRISTELPPTAPAALLLELRELIVLAEAVQSGEAALRAGRTADVVTNSEAVGERHATGSGHVRALLVGQLWLQAALAHQRDGDARGELVAVRSARMVDPQQPGTASWQAALEQRLGRDGAARQHFDLAAANAADPLLRLLAAGNSSAAAALAKADGNGLRAEIGARIAAGDLGAANNLLHTAHDRDPDPRADLQLLHELQLRQGDARRALGTALLLREYAPSAASERRCADGFAALDQGSLAARARLRGHQLAPMQLLSPMQVAMFVLRGQTPEGDGLNGEMRAAPMR
jgi:hypothetical protein